MMQWYSPNITQSPFTSSGIGQHAICWFYTYKNNLCLSVTQQTISGKRGRKKESGGEVNLFIPKSSNMPSLNTLRSKHTKGQVAETIRKSPSLFTPLRNTRSKKLCSNPWSFPSLSQPRMLRFVMSRPTKGGCK